MRDAASDAGFDDDVADLLGDAAAAVDATYSVTYAVETGSVVVTQRPPDRRVETTSADGTVDVVLTVDGATHACTNPPGDEAFRCDQLGAPPATGVFDADAVAAFTDALAESADTFDLRVEQDTIVATDARCLVTEPPSARLCIAATGAILLVERPTGTLRATAYTTDVPDAAFVLPAS